MTFDELCKDFDRRRPTGEPIKKSLFFCERWDNGNDSINDILRRFLRRRGYRYLSVMGTIWFLLGGEWCHCEIQPKNGKVYFYLCQYAKRGGESE